MSTAVASTVVCHALIRAASGMSVMAELTSTNDEGPGGAAIAHHRPTTLECSMTAPVASKATAKMRLRLSAATRGASRAPSHAAVA
jgi:hypothetical protein